MRNWWRYAEVYMVYGEHWNKSWWNLGGVVELVRTFCQSRKFRARRRVRGPKVPGKAGRSGSRNVRAGPDVPVVGILPRTETWRTWVWAEKLGGKAQIRRGERRNWRKRRVGRLDLRATHKIHGSKPTKSQHTNKSQKKIGAIFGGDFRIRTKNNKIRLETQWRGSEIVINLAHDTKMM